MLDCTCTKCDLPVHNDCSVLETDDNTGELQFLCQLCQRDCGMKRNRTGARDNLLKQAEYMKQASIKKLGKLEIGDTVRVPVSEFDRAKSDARNILARVMDYDHDSALYTLGTKSGLLNFKYVRSQLTPCKRRLIEEEDVNQEKTLPLRTVATNQSVSGRGQGMVKCNCNKCEVGRSKCRTLYKRACNSRCHPRKSCNNPYNDM